MKDTKRIIINILFFMFLIFITYYIIIRENDIDNIVNSLKELNYFYLSIAFIIMSMYFVLESLNLRFLLNSFDEKVGFFKVLKYCLVCFFFSAITPAASGGQPMAIFYMSKDNIKVSHSTLAFLVELLGYNMSKIIIGLISFILITSEIRDDLKYFYILGLFFSLIPVILTLIGLFNKKLSKKLVAIVIKIMEKFKVKNVEEKIENINNEVEVYNESAKYVRKHKKEFIKSLLLSFIQVLSFQTITFFVYRSFGLADKNIVLFIMLGALLQNCASSIPLPGAVGITETVFLVIYGYIYTDNMLQGALIVNRSVTFYLFVLIGFIAYIITIIQLNNRKELKETINN